MVLGALGVNSRTIYIFMMICDDLICHNSYIIQGGPKVTSQSFELIARSQIT